MAIVNRRGDPAYWRTKDEAYEAGRELGFDRGYEEGRAANTPAPAPGRVREPVSERKIAKTGIALVLAYGVWRLLKTWPGRLTVVGSLFVFSGLVSLGMVVLALIVGAFALAWALRTAERTVADTKSALRTSRAAIGAVRHRG